MIFSSQRLEIQGIRLIEHVVAVTVEVPVISIIPRHINLSRTDDQGQSCVKLMCSSGKGENTGQTWEIVFRKSSIGEKGNIGKGKNFQNRSIWIYAVIFHL